MAIQRLTLIWMILFLVTGCGFHLRKPHPNQVSSIELKDTPNCARFKNQLISYFNSYDIKIIDSTDTLNHSTPNHPVVLSYSCPVLSEQPLVYDAEGQLRRERLTQTIEITIDRQTPKTITAIRERQLNSNQSLADNAEKNLILKEMQQELLYKLTLQLA